MNPENKKAIFSLAAGLLLFYLTVRVLRKKDKDKQPTVTAENINVASAAYMEAYHAGEPDTKLIQINDELKKLYGLSVSSMDGTTFTVSDLSGKLIKTITNQ